MSRVPQAGRWPGSASGRTHVKIFFFAFILLLIVSCREADYSSQLPKIGRNTVGIIDPDKSIYGIPMSTPRKSFVAAYGEPTGIVKLTNSEIALLYGVTHAFIFNEDALSGVCIRDRVVDWKLSSSIASNMFDSVTWKLSNGITNEMSLTAVKRLLGTRLAGDSGYYDYAVGKSRVDLDFSHYTHEGSGDSSHHVFGLQVRR
jgi:hypothetical protein